MKEKLRGLLHLIHATAQPNKCRFGLMPGFLVTLPPNMQGRYKDESTT